VNAPDDLRARVTRDLRPVRPHLRPWQRLVLLVPAAALAFAAAPAAYGIRGDIVNMGTLLGWGGSLAQLAVALVLMRAALREAVPGDAMPASTTRLLLAAGIAVTILLGFITHVVSPEPYVRHETLSDWYYCWRGLVVAGLPLLLVLVVLLVRGLAARPGLAGALSGLSVGAAVDGGWRLSCSYSSPVHVFPSHGGAVLTLTVVGIAIAVTVARLRQK
jgi:hypothetical protein